ncbi:MBL fold metallo-hydrolase [Streptacidiphilus jiangxiensis]|uniref:L-ascorbate metabolism protein UlaG, beta-lactamase superfamily n=1 Tax=Streptacidiphilus jiangxiensis TaxID=235985 RepID=A0A1H7TK79_STRJI|nr:MBL fold metallo-hydrolase [Streptacidiphilus jiangxiensis]SEL85250.1 L-ascorbate metabolism protein UlaG, beta-lactamase superfamily [Streptacidiphilus jiangxiensis]
MGLNRAGRIAAGVGAAGAAAVAWAAREVPVAFGGDPTSGSRGDRLKASPQYREGTFHNPPGPERTGDFSRPDSSSVARELLFGKQQRKPSRPIPLVRDIAQQASEDLAVTWFGHSSALVEIEGHRLLLDPVWSERCSPSQSVGPRRLHNPPVELERLPEIDAVLISHDHYDHLDMHTIRALARLQSMPFVVPLGVGAHLERWGVERSRVIELDWEETAEVGALRLVCTSAYHFSGRGFSNNGTLWSSWAILGSERRVFYSGDSGYFDGFRKTGEQFGQFDLTLVQIGAYSEHWPDIHMTPEEGLRTHLDVRGELLVPVHWCTFVLGLHDWSEPVERLCEAADAAGVTLAVPRPGERLEVTAPPKLDHWWRTVV